MSADNGIYILITSVDHSGKKEYRVAHLQAVENVYWDDRTGRNTDDSSVHIANARLMWKNALVFDNERDAMDEAYRLSKEIYDDMGILEYGMCIIDISNEIFFETDQAEYAQQIRNIFKEAGYFFSDQSDILLDFLVSQKVSPIAFKEHLQKTTKTDMSVKSMAIKHGIPIGDTKNLRQYEFDVLTGEGFDEDMVPDSRVTRVTNCPFCHEALVENKAGPKEEWECGTWRDTAGLHQLQSCRIAQLEAELGRLITLVQLALSQLIEIRPIETCTCDSTINLICESCETRKLAANLSDGLTHSRLTLLNQNIN